MVALKGLQAGCNPKDVIAQLAEGLLAHYTGKPLIDKYDVYQHLMDYLAATMQDDCYLVAVDGWKARPLGSLRPTRKAKKWTKAGAVTWFPNHSSSTATLPRNRRSSTNRRPSILHFAKEGQST